MSCLCADGNWFFHWWELMPPLIQTEGSFPCGTVSWNCCLMQVSSFVQSNLAIPAFMCSWHSQLLIGQFLTCFLLSAKLFIRKCLVCVFFTFWTQCSVQKQGMDPLQSCDSAKTPFWHFYVCLLTGFPLEQRDQKLSSQSTVVLYTHLCLLFPKVRGF